MTLSDPVWAQLGELDPARDIVVDQARADALLEQMRTNITTGGPQAPRPSRRRGRGRRLVGSVPVVVGVLVVVAIVGVALSELRRGSPHSARESVPGVSARRALPDILAVLRRPQTALDREAFARSGVADRGRGLRLGFGDVDPASARLATITPWGSRVGLAVVLPLTRSQVAAARRSGSVIARGLTANAPPELIVWSDHGWGGAGTVSSIQAGHAMITEGWGPSYAGGSTGVRAEVVVPDGVARVTFVLPQTAAPRSHGPRYARPLRITVAVHGNIAAFEAHRSCCHGTIPMIWYGADGRVIKRIGDVSAAETTRPAARPTPAPATAASRAAEHNPATPNPVTVTPRIGGPTTRFRLSWRLLLTGADYQFDPVGPQGSDCYGANAIPGGLGGGTTDVRGQIYGQSLGPLPSQPWCPGTYRVSVSVLDLGPGRPPLSPAPKPFGSTTFTVRR